MENKKVELNDEMLDKIAGGYFATKEDEEAINSLYNNLLSKNPGATDAINGFYAMAKTSTDPLTYDYVYALVSSIPGIIL